VVGAISSRHQKYVVLYLSLNLADCSEFRVHTQHDASYGAPFALYLVHSGVVYRLSWVTADRPVRAGPGWLFTKYVDKSLVFDSKLVFFS